MFLGVRVLLTQGINMVLEMEAINRKLQTAEEFSRLVPLEEVVVEGKFYQMTDIIINKDF